MKRIMLLVVMVTLLAFAIASAASDKIASSKNGKQISTMTVKSKSKIIGDNELSLANVPYIPSNPNHIAASPGDTIGFTSYEFQSNRSSGNRIARDHLGGLHFAWMRSSGGLTPRTVYYNYVSTPGAPPERPGTGTNISTAGHINDGYTQISLTTDDLAVIAHHNGLTESLYVATDISTGFGDFSNPYRTRILFAGDTENCLWPYITVDRNNRYHMIASEAAPAGEVVQTLGYLRSTNGGQTWTTPAVVDTLVTISAILTSSPVSDKVAVVYTHPYDTSSQWINDVYYIMLQNGTQWFWRDDKVNITNYASTPESLWAYTDCDAVFDFNDNLHIIWNEQGAWVTDGGTQVEFLSRIRHWDLASGTNTQVMKSDSTWVLEGCDYGAWNHSLAKMSIGVDSVTAGLFVTATGWYMTDCAADGFANGEIFMSYSTNGGANWTLRGDLTNSHTDSCLAGECDSDHWSSLAERADENLHLFYVNDLDAGAFVQTNPQEGSLTYNPMLYLHYPNPIRNTTVPSAPSLIFPYDDSTFGSAFYVFEWSDPVGVVRYEIQIATDVGFANIVESNTNVDHKEYINVDGFLPDEYFWRVRSVGYYGTSAWSTTFNFIVDYIGIQGHVYEQNGTTPITDAIVAAISGDLVDTSVAATNAAGYYVLPVPGPNAYDLIVGKDGYADTTVDGYSITIGVPTLDFRLHPPAGGCDYIKGDINNSGGANGVDVVYGVAYFKGGAAPKDSCNCPPTPFPFYAAGDVNGNCAFNGIDITYFVAYLKGIQPALQNCATCPPAVLNRRF